MERYIQVIKNYGYFNEELGGFTLTEFPKVGNYEYIYKNDEILVKVDQYGFQTCQIDPPIGVALIKRERREMVSPIRVYFSFDGKIYHNFDGFSAKNVGISFTPQKVTYLLDFGEISVKTEILTPVKGMRFIMRITFVNHTEKELDVSLLSVVYPYVNELMMAPWDKPEWYTNTKFDKENNVFLTTRYSVAGKKEERRYFSFLSDLRVQDYELSSERVTEATNNFACIPEKFSGLTEKELYAFEQCMASISSFKIAGNSSYSFTNVFATAVTEESVEESVEESKNYFSQEKMFAEEIELKAKYEKLFSVRTVNTPDKTFDRFINGFLPLELDWVSALDRGWPTGMRGVRDASNDFQGFLAYDIEQCKGIIENIFSKQRSDGWYPRQVPFGVSDKFDLRQFVDSACFFTEFVYDYLAYSGDYSILEKEYGYYDSELIESGLTHLVKGMEYLLAPENTGEHGLTKSRGGDWLDCLNSAGLKGRGETVMVSCQLVMCLKYLAEILEKFGEAGGDKYVNYANKLKETIDEVSYNKEGFYNGVFTDNGVWIFSDKDPDGEKRVYVPTNSYAIISGVAEGKEQSIINHIEKLQTENGYKLFSTPFGKKYMEGIGKMGTGDFQPYFAENASVYNHGSQFFYLRALAEVGDYDKFYKVLNFAMPFNENNHKERDICSAPYAITNCYHLVPSFCGRAGFSFLTGSVAMLERAVYNWLFGVRFTLGGLYIKPCLPKEYQNSDIAMQYLGKTLKIKFNGYGNKVGFVHINGKKVEVKNGVLKLDTNNIVDNMDIVLELSKHGEI